MQQARSYCIPIFFVSVYCILLSIPASAANDTASLAEAFKQGTVQGQLKTYFFAQWFDGDGVNDSEIWVNGGNLTYKTANYYGIRLGATFQASFVGHKDDDDGKTAGTLDADGAVLSEAFISYRLSNTKIEGGRQYLKYPLVAGSSSRMINESFEAYLISNEDIPDTTVTAGFVTKYQTRTDRSNYADNWFVEFDQNGTGDPGDFYDIGKDGFFFLYAKNNSVENLEMQAQYGNVFDEVSALYVDATYTFNAQFKPYLAGQFYYTDYDDNVKDSNSLFGIKAGVNISDFEIFTGFTAAGGNAGDERVFRGIGQSACFIYTVTTKTSGSPAFEAGTDSFQVGALFSNKGLATKLSYTLFDNPAANKDLDEYTLNFSYKPSGLAAGFSVSIDFSILDYENSQKDAADLRSRLIYTF